MENESIHSLIFIKLLEKPMDSLLGGFSVWQSQLNDNYTCYDLDNFSDDISMSYGKSLVEQSTSLLLIVDASDSQDLGKTMGFITPLLKLRNKISTILIGEHLTLHKVLRKTGEKSFHAFSSTDEALQWVNQKKIN